MRRHLSSVGPLLALCWTLALGCGPRSPAGSPTEGKTDTGGGKTATPVSARDADSFAPAPHGALEPTEVSETHELSAAQYSLEAGLETWVFELPESALADDAATTWSEARVDVQGEAVSGLLAFTDRGIASGASGLPKGERVLRIWLRRRPSTPRSFEAVLADVYQPARVARGEQQPGRRARFRLVPRAEARAQAGLFAAYLQALGERAANHDPIGWLLGTEQNAGERRAERAPGGAEPTSDWMRAASGYDSLEDALQTSAVLRGSRVKEPTPFSITSLEGPRLATHPWAEMSKRLPGRPAPELMASFVPADFYYFRAKDYPSFERFLGHADTFGTPAFHALSPHGKLLNLADAYRTELGIPENEWARVFGPTLISELALTGSDPFLQSGSDLTLILRVKNAALFLAALEVPRESLKMELSRSVVRHGAHEVTIYQRADGVVRQHVARALVGGAELVAISNSLRAIERVLDVWAQKSPSLAAEPDFSYMLARDAGLEGELLFFAGDRFIARSMSPAQRILDARRHLAHADLLRLSYSDLVYRRVFGRAPASADELFRAPWLGAAYRTHVTGEKIEVVPGRAPRSRFGAPRRMSSLVDLPPVERVTASEKSGYEELARDYEAIWGTRIDPIALRATTEGDAVELHLRVLPVSRSGQYEEMERLSGGGTTRRKSPLPGVAGILALGAESPLRQLLSSQGRGFLGYKVDFDWLGEFVEMGLVDGPEIWRLALNAPEVPRPPGAPGAEHKGEIERLAELPLYLTLDIRSQGGAALFLAAAKKLATDAAPGAFEWGEFNKVGKHAVVRIHSHDINLFYVLTERRLHLALSFEVLRELLAHGDGASEATSTALVTTLANSQPGGEFNFDLAPEHPKSGLFLALAWLLEGQRFEGGVADPKAELLLSALPELTADASSYLRTSRELLGYSPVTPEGAPFQLRPEGLTDPLRGSRYRPVWPDAPVKGGPLARVFELFRAARLELAVDAEPGSESERSLRSRVRVELEPPSSPPRD